MNNDKKNTAVNLLVAALSLAVIILAAAQLLGYIDNAVLINMPLMAVTCWGLAYIIWDKSKKVAYMEIAVGVALILCTLGALFVHG